MATRRCIANATLAFGLVSVPVKLYTATRSHDIKFNLLHATDKSRIKQRLFCAAEDKPIERSDTVKGFEVEKGAYVTFSDDELAQLEGDHDRTMRIDAFVPLNEVDPVHFATAYQLAPTPEAEHAYRLLAAAMEREQRVAIGHLALRNKEHLVLLRPFRTGLLLHLMFKADEVVVDVIESHDNFTDAEMQLAVQLIDGMSRKHFTVTEYAADDFRQRLLEAAHAKLDGKVVEPPAPKRAQVTDLMDALKASIAAQSPRKKRKAAA